ncbi:pyridoxal phosphate-dependent transferase [Syncephalastrum racemosum]|uniref:Pyridoxal phosphate-dependent transferase n=1 Tax=Syncephalastrum racemosum TaxID=13706 RepID=A0A1X2H4Y6_SYNRA|nr:pyridoxal phosphate-dependent transferase [Syncephalastrum racemosum]
MPAFGRALRKDFPLEPGYVPVNQGSYGTFPRVVRQKAIEYQEQCEQHPDRFMRIEAPELLKQSRSQLAALVGCPDPADIAFIENATMAANTVLRSFPFAKGDKVLCNQRMHVHPLRQFSTGYVNVNKTLEFVSHYKDIELVLVELHYPLSDQAVLDKAAEAIDQNPGIRMAVFDAISSQPGVLFPFEAMTRLVQKNGILAFIDGAHAVGQIPLDLQAIDPDFFLSNCHKWLYVPRGNCFLYVAKRCQQYVHPLGINNHYKQADHPAFSFEKEFLDLGAVDYSSVLTIKDALAYRASIGGEDAIQEYCHNLAVQGGALVAEFLGTSVLENEERTLTASMVNVELPLTNAAPAEVIPYFTQTLIYEHHTMIPVFPIGGKIYARLSAQIYTDLEDFKEAADALKKTCQAFEAKN